MHIDMDYLASVVAVIGFISGGVRIALNRHKKVVAGIVEDMLNDALPEKIEESVKTGVTSAVQPIDTRLTVIETKMEVFWKDVALDAAKILHHPEPSRAHVDALLDSFMEGRLSDDEARELRGYLEVIRDWEPGFPAPFKIFQGEQVAAAILLHTMDHAINIDRGGK